jgi:hypothetical protein
MQMVALKGKVKLINRNLRENLWAVKNPERVGGKVIEDYVAEYLANYLTNNYLDHKIQNPSQIKQNILDNIVKIFLGAYLFETSAGGPNVWDAQNAGNILKPTFEKLAQDAHDRISTETMGILRRQN